LEYMRLGQSLTTLSGGEAQRLKLAAHIGMEKEVSVSLFKDGKDGQPTSTLFIFDEPTTGLHFADIQKLLNAFNQLVDRGHSLLIIEHNLEVIKCADHVIDLGPEGGDKGGEVIATGTPEEVAKVKKSYTGQYLASVLGLGSRAQNPKAKKGKSQKPVLPALVPQAQVSVVEG